MIIYNIIFISVICGIVLEYRNSRYVSIIFILEVLLITLAIGFRNEYMGNDTTGYLDFFANPNNVYNHYAFDNKTGQLEPFLGWFNKFIRLFTINKYVYSFIIALISNIPVFYFIEKHSPRRSFSVFLLLSFSIGASFFILSFQMIRQMLAVAFSALALHLYIKNGYKINYKIIILSFCMLLTHSSSVMLFLLPLLMKVNINKHVYVIATILLSFVGFFMSKYASVFIAIASQYGKGFYFTHIGDFSYVSLLPYIVTFLITIYSLSKKDCNSIYVKGFFLFIFILCVMAFYGNNVPRMCLYYSLLSFIAIPEMLVKLRKKNKFIFIVFTVCFIGYFTYKYYLNLNLEVNNQMIVYPLVPYKSCFE